MFDKHFHTHDNSVRIDFPDTIEVKEIKAPTDESIRLLNEMENKARKNIIAKVHVDDNHLNGVAIMYHENGFIPSISDTVCIHLKFSINGIEYRIEETVKRNLFDQDAFKLGVQLKDHLKGTVANAIFNHLKIKIIEKMTGQEGRLEKQTLSHKRF